MLPDPMHADSERYDWRTEHLPTVILAFVRALGDPALAWDVGTEAMATASRSWGTFPGGSRMAWVLEHGHAVLRDAREVGRVPSHERRRNRATVSKTLGPDEERALREQSRASLGLDPEAAAVVNALEREAPPRRVLLDIALSPLTRRDGQAPGRDRA